MIQDILNEEYLISLGFQKIVDDNGYGKYKRVDNTVKFGPRYEQLRITRAANVTHSVIMVQYAEAFANTVFSGRIDSNETFEIILKAVL